MHNSINWAIFSLHSDDIYCNPHCIFLTRVVTWSLNHYTFRFVPPPSSLTAFSCALLRQFLYDSPVCKYAIFSQFLPPSLKNMHFLPLKFGYSHREKEYSLPCSMGASHRGMGTGPARLNSMKYETFWGIPWRSDQSERGIIILEDNSS